MRLAAFGSARMTGDSEVINLDRKPGQLLEAQSTLDGV
jgi:hypothetical protein